MGCVSGFKRKMVGLKLRQKNVYLNLKKVEEDN